MSYAKMMRTWMRNANQPQGTGTTFSKNGRPIVHTKPGEAVREKRMAEGAAALVDVFKELKK